MNYVLDEDEPTYFFIVPYQDQWQWMFVIEYAEELRSVGKNVVVISLDVLNLNFLKRWILGRAGYQPVNPEITKTLENSGISVLRPNPFRNWIQTNFRPSPALTETTEKKIIQSHLVDKTKSLNFESFRSKSTSRRLRKEARFTFNHLLNLHIPKKSVILTPSGRYARNRAVLFFAESLDLDYKVLDSGSTDRYIVVRDAQSIDEGVELVTQHWRQGNRESREKIGIDYFEARFSNLRTSHDQWTWTMKKGLLPDLDDGKRICVFYTTTQIEFVGTESNFRDNYFQSQVEAIKAAREKLDPAKWELLVRRHPKRRGQSNRNDDLIDGIYDIKGIRIIEADSAVDSYALAERADLVLHFGSHIGAEIIYLKYAPVYCMNKTPWWKFDPLHHPFTKSDWLNFDPENLTYADPDSVLPLGYFAMTGGQEFKHIMQKPNKGWVYGDYPIYLSLNTWLKNALRRNR
jgi:hypothetical protein